MSPVLHGLTHANEKQVDYAFARCGAGLPHKAMAAKTPPLAVPSDLLTNSVRSSASSKALTWASAFDNRKRREPSRSTKNHLRYVLLQNALAQVKAFDEALYLTGSVVIKGGYGMAKGGVLAAIALWGQSRSASGKGVVPVYFIGVGEAVVTVGDI
jgi:hypothetical protein